ncbi:MAG: hypothetical protein AAF481_06720 [Acidobacteriota bacterium]
MSEALTRRVAAFLSDPSPDDFDALAAEAFAYQYERIEPFRRLCDERGVRPGDETSWREVPAVPTTAFQSLKLAAEEPRRVFRSSGTTSATAGSAEEDRRSTHHHPFPDLYRAAIDASFPAFCLAGFGERPPILSLIPPRDDSSLAFMAGHVMERFGAPDSATGFGKKRLDIRASRSWLGARQRDRRPSLLFTTSFALASLLDSLEKQFLHFRLAPGSAIFETGGFKGRTKEVDRAELHRRTEEWLGVAPDRVVGEYGMTELTSQLYARTLLGGEADVFVAPHWVRARIVDPQTLEEAPAGEEGLVSIFDLANLGSAVHLLTEDLGVAAGDGIRLLGRAAGADLRGCSLAVEELTG